MKSPPHKINLFVYGTLTDPSLLYQITGKHFPASPAILRSFRRFISYLGYPYILPGKGFTTKGLLIRNIDPESIKSLDRYEGEGTLYFRKRIAVVSQGKRVSCEVYVGNPKRLRSQS